MTGGDVPSHAVRASPDVTSVAADAEVGGTAVRALVASGADGASFAATTPSLGPVELWRLKPAALTADVRRRIAALQQLAHPSLLAVHALHDDPACPALVVGRGALRWGDPSAHAGRPGWLRQQLAGLFDGLAAAHRWNVVHGAIGPRSIALTEEGRLVLDLTGLDVRGLGRPARAPEVLLAGATAAADVWALATVAQAIPESAGLDLAPLREADPERRPSARAAAITLAQDQPTLVHHGEVLPAPAGDLLDGVPRQLGPYRLLATIGTGGMGRVFRAADVDGTEVAVKVLLPSFAEDPEAVARFRREARVLAQLQTPHVARFVAANEHRGFQFLAMELAGGRPAADLVKERGRLDPDLVLAIGCDVARALAEVHALGLVHRDVKPANILVDGEGASPAVRLCDFGIARPALAAGDDQVTAAGRPGTPSFMAPEQVDGQEVDARSDVYALGCTLYALLAGRPPFQGIPQYVMIAHVSEPPPPILEVEPSVPPGLAAIVMRCLAKNPAERPADGAALVEILEGLRRGVAASAESLPQAIGLAGEPRVYDFQWRLRATCEELWPHVSNTDRINRAAGLDDVEWTHSPGDGQVHTEGKFRAAGIELRWKENPFEWVAPHRLGVVREYLGGPFLWLRSMVELIRRPDGETALRHRIEILPRGLFGRAAAGVEIGFRLRRSLERVYAHVDAACIAARAPATAAGAADPFEDPETVEANVRHAIEERVGRIVGRGGDPLIADALARDVGALPAPNLARLRPRRWARDHGFAEEATLDVFLLAAAEGLLELRWDILCPSCRIPSSIEDSLRALQSHGRCDVCDLDFEHDLARSVELVFRAHPAIRQADAGVYCIGGPAHSPHVVAQVRLPAGERIALDLALGEGRYEVRGRGLPRAWPFAVDARAPLSTWDLPLSTGVAVSVARSLGAEGQRLLLTNDLGHEVLVRVERVTARQDVVTAAEAATHGRFRELFPEQVLAPERLVSVSEVALVFAQVGDALDRYQADEGEVHRQLVAISEGLQRAATLEGGAVVRLQGDGVMAVFTDRAAALRAALAFADPRSNVAISIHAGPARMTTIGGHLDYFGRTLHVAEHMGRVSQAGEILVGEPILATASLVPLLRARTEPLGFLDVGATLVARVRPVDADATRVSP